MQVTKIKKKKAIVLLSGGIDSVTTLYLAKKKGFNPTALIFDYEQRHKKEINSARKIAKSIRCPFRVINLSLPRKGSSLLNKKASIPVARSLKQIKKGIPSTYVPARNLIFLSIAASFAESINAKAIFIGAHTEDYSGYPDCRGKFFGAFKETMKMGTIDGKYIKVYTPLLKKDKKEIIKTGLKLKVPFQLTWSCYKGGRRPCGVCDSCFFRARSFKELGMKDPYYARS